MREVAAAKEPQGAPWVRAPQVLTCEAVGAPQGVPAEAVAALPPFLQATRGWQEQVGSCILPRAVAVAVAALAPCLRLASSRLLPRAVAPLLAETLL